MVFSPSLEERGWGRGRGTIYDVIIASKSSYHEKINTPFSGSCFFS